MEEFIGEQEDKLTLIKKMLVNYGKTPQIRFTEGYMRTRLQTLQEYWEKFMATHANIVKSSTAEERKTHIYFVEDWYDKAESVYIELKSNMEDKLQEIRENKAEKDRQRQQQPPPQNPTENVQVRLPKIDVPKFSGNYQDWSSFRDMYKSLIHNNTSISKVNKFHYLKTSVTGEAEQLLKHIPITERNYDNAWDVLIKRFDNKRVIVNSILSRLFNQKKLSTGTAKGIKDLLDTTSECMSNLKNNDVHTINWDPLIIYIVVNKLDEETHKYWEEELGTLPVDILPKIERLMKFLETRFRILEMVYSSNPKEKIISKTKSFVTTSTPSSSEKPCSLCKENHPTMMSCKEFTKLNVNQRIECVQRERLCFNCLSPKHNVKHCKSKHSCRECRKRHHTLLHYPNQRENNETPESPTHGANNKDRENETGGPQVIRSHLITQGQNALMATALVNVQTGRGLQSIRALIDPCSQESFISEAVVHKLQLHRKQVNGQVTGVDQMTAQVKHATEINIQSRVNNFTIPCTAFVIKHVTDILPAEKMNRESWPHLQNLILADPTYFIPGSVDMLLGVNIYTDILMSGVLRGEPGSPIAQQPQLGWIISGGARENNARGIVSMHLSITLDRMLQRFWETDTLTNDENDTLTDQETRAEEIYEQTVTREPDGRYVVALPFKRDIPVIPEKSRAIALMRLSHLERRLSINDKLRQEYNRVIKEYLELKHLEPIPESEKSENVVYLPHHAVVRDDKETTKVRVVYDASCKGTNGISLNDELLIGPSLQDELRSIILRWRMHKICFVADIIKMYRQILIREEDLDFQRILWRFNTSDVVKEYRLLTVTFGMACAPYLAVKTLKRIAEDEGEDENLLLAKEIVNNDFYVDDCLSGSHDERTAIEAQRQLTEMLRRGGFELQKWSSNSEIFMEEIKPEKRSQESDVNINRKNTIKALGIIWNVKEDELQINNQVKIDSERKITKRNVLAVIASLFDPMGWIAPTIVKAKIFMQKLWIQGFEWDEDLPNDYREEWLKFQSEIENLSEIRIPRWIRTTPECQKRELHGFADASTSAYAAVIYSRITESDGSIHTSLLMAKTKVAPVKQLSLPRLELCATVLLIQLLKHVAKAMRIDPKSTYAWSDSKVALAWIKGDPLRWNTYVKNRVIEISGTMKTTWSYVETKQNPADPASRGLLPEKLRNNELWWNGPSFLKEKDINTQAPINHDDVPETMLEMKDMKIYATKIETPEKKKDILTLLQRFSSLKKLLAVVAWIRRWLHLKKEKEISSNLPNFITYEEREEALTVCVKLSQNLEFPEEYKNLMSGTPLKRSSRLTSLNPFVDEKGVLRVGGRLKHADIEFLQKHPIIISKNNVLLPLLLSEAHAKTLHGGPQMMVTYLRQKYWLIDAGNTVKRFVRNCMTCAKQRTVTRTQLMGSLPECRVKPSRPFSISGVDFAGPISARMSKGRGAKSYKAYIAIFICMATKAIHIELVSDMTTDAFMAAYRRFISRRGACKEMWSDNGTTFVSASKEILETWKQGKSCIPDELSMLLDGEGTKWKFIPPGAPNFGGLWEAGVKSIKFHLKRIMGDSTLTFEELNTLLNQIEACLNSRPLSPISDHPRDLEPLTPAHFLIGEPTISVPEKNYTDMSVHSLSRWQQIQRMMQTFWKKWLSEYMTRLQERPKWTSPKTEFEIGDLLLIKDPRCPPSKWLLGRVVAKHPGRDNLTRTYDVRTASGVYTRAVSKLCPLPDV